MMPPVNGIARHVLQRVMHEPMFHLKPKPNPPLEVGLKRRKRRGLFAMVTDAGMGHSTPRSSA